MKIRCWGTIGSIPTPGAETVKYGGNTPCLEVRLDNGRLIIFDGGTGIRPLGLELMKSGQAIKAQMIMTHVHWDHIQGFPFFVPAYIKGNQFDVIASPQAGGTVRKIFDDLMVDPYFPITFDVLAADFRLLELGSSEVEVGDIRMTSILTNHPQDTYAFRIEENGKSFVFMTDNELLSPTLKDIPFEEHVGFCAGADLLIHDAMYTDEEYERTVGWGHSTWRSALKLAMEAGVRRFGLYHHDPEHSDDDVESMVEDCRKEIAQNGIEMECFATDETTDLIL
jgi:phosphoribosyl 1,2-cyclic phosphodiesterase